MHAALRDDKTLPQDIDKILLARGSTRIPLVHRMIEERIGLAPSAELNPDLIVALGAAVQGGIIAGDEVGAILVDIATHTFSRAAMDLENMGMVCVPIVPRGTPLPVTRSEAVTTRYDDQDKVQVQVQVYQGESRAPLENLLIGEFMVTGLGMVPADNAITSQFSLDLDGLLEVTAIEKSTGLAKAVTIDTRDVKASFDLTEVRQRVSDTFGGGTAEEADEVSAPADGVHEETTRAKDLRKRADKLMAGDLDDEDRADIQRLLAEIVSAIKARDFATLRDRSDQIEDIIFYLEE